MFVIVCPMELFGIIEFRIFFDMRLAIFKIMSVFKDKGKTKQNYFLVCIDFVRPTR